MRLFRQDNPGDWSGPIKRIQGMLPVFIAAHQRGAIKNSEVL